MSETEERVTGIRTICHMLLRLNAVTLTPLSALADYFHAFAILVVHREKIAAAAAAEASSDPRIVAAQRRETAVG